MLITVSKNQSFQKQLSVAHKSSHIAPWGFSGMSGALESHQKVPCFFTYPPQGAYHPKYMANSHSLIFSSTFSVLNFNQEGELS